MEGLKLTCGAGCLVGHGVAESWLGKRGPRRQCLGMAKSTPWGEVATITGSILRVRPASGCGRKGDQGCKCRCVPGAGWSGPVASAVGTKRGYTGVVQARHVGTVYGAGRGRDPFGSSRGYSSSGLQAWT